MEKEGLGVAVLQRKDSLCERMHTHILSRPALHNVAYAAQKEDH